VPEGVRFRASVPCSNGGIEEKPIRLHNLKKWPCNIYKAVVKQKTGELYLAVDADQWKESAKKMALSESRNNAQSVAKQTRQRARR